MNELQTKPPLGIMPEKLWKQQRAYDLIECMSRYSRASIPIRTEWFSELVALLGDLVRLRD